MNAVLRFTDCQRENTVGLLMLQNIQIFRINMHYKTISMLDNTSTLCTRWCTLSTVIESAGVSLFSSVLWVNRGGVCVCLFREWRCRRKRPRTGWPTRVRVSPSWRVRDRPPATAGVIRATCSPPQPGRTSPRQPPPQPIRTPDSTPPPPTLAVLICSSSSPPI